MKKKIIKIIVLVLAGGLLVLVGYFWGEKIGFNTGYGNGWQAGYKDGFDTQKAAIDLGASASVGNPLDKIPTANPFEDSVNPFK